MTLRVIFQMDALHHLNPKIDSSLALMEEGFRRGYEIYHYLPTRLSWSEGELKAYGARVIPQAQGVQSYTLGNVECLALKTFDVLFIRQDPPFNMEYLTATYLLDHLVDKVLMINDPQGIRQSPEKILVTHFADLMPPTLITQETDLIENFKNFYQDIILKPLYEFGGESVVRLTSDDHHLLAILELFKKAYPHQPWMIQKFVPEIFEGDRRLFLLEGKLIGGYSRIPPHNSIRSNGARGGRTEAITLTARDYEIADRIGPTLEKLGLMFVGIDVIGPYLTEINVTSPTGLRILDSLYNMNSAAIIWDKLEKKCKIA